MLPYAARPLRCAPTLLSNASASLLSTSRRTLTRSPNRIIITSQQYRCKYTRTYGTQPLLGRYLITPRKLFRVNAGELIRLRLKKEDEWGPWDLTLKDGIVKPAVGDMFNGPNGASLRPNTFAMHEIVLGFYAPKVVVYKLPEDTQLPNDLILLHEHSDHYSIQCSKPMSLGELDDKITNFLKGNGTCMTREDFLEKYPFETCEER